MDSLSRLHIYFLDELEKRGIGVESLGLDGERRVEVERTPLPPYSEESQGKGTVIYFIVKETEEELAKCELSLSEADEIAPAVRNPQKQMPKKGAISVNWLFVNPNFQGAGLGALMLQFAMVHIASRCDESWVYFILDDDSDRANYKQGNLYESMGFNPVDKITLDKDDDTKMFNTGGERIREIRTLFVDKMLKAAPLRFKKLDEKSSQRKWPLTVQPSTVKNQEVEDKLEEQITSEEIDSILRTKQIIDAVNDRVEVTDREKGPMSPGGTAGMENDVYKEMLREFTMALRRTETPTRKNQHVKGCKWVSLGHQLITHMGHNPVVLKEFITDTVNTRNGFNMDKYPELATLQTMYFNNKLVEGAHTVVSSEAQFMGMCKIPPGASKIFLMGIARGDYLNHYFNITVRNNQGKYEMAVDSSYGSSWVSIRQYTTEMEEGELQRLIDDVQTQETIRLEKKDITIDINQGLPMVDVRPEMLAKAKTYPTYHFFLHASRGTQIYVDAIEEDTRFIELPKNRRYFYFSPEMGSVCELWESKALAGRQVVVLNVPGLTDAFDKFKTEKPPPPPSSPSSSPSRPPSLSSLPPPPPSSPSSPPIPPSSSSPSEPSSSSPSELSSPLPPLPPLPPSSSSELSSPLPPLPPLPPSSSSELSSPPRPPSLSSLPPPPPSGGRRLFSRKRGKKNKETRNKRNKRTRKI
jgi:GNAT superfamily N-acetyltransferase